MAGLRDRRPWAGTAVEHYEQGLCQRLERDLATVAQVVLHGRATHRTPTLLLSVTGHPSSEVQSYLAGLDVNATSGSFYSLEASRRMGLGDTGAVRVGLAPYTNSSDVARLVEGLRAFVAENQVAKRSSRRSG